MRLGVFGGTFDPIHNGHLVAAVNARHAAGLDQVLLVVANQPWQKSAARAITPARYRLAVVEAAVEGVPGLAASAIEINRGGRSYTADTLAELRDLHPEAELFLIVGADVAASLGTWERVEEVAALSTLIVVSRPGRRASEPSVRGAMAQEGMDPLVGAAAGVAWRGVMTVEIPALDISSTDLRARAADGRPLDFLVPPAAIRCIRQRGLYSGAQDDDQRQGPGTRARPDSTG